MDHADQTISWFSFPHRLFDRLKMEVELYEAMSQQTTMNNGELEQLPSFSPPRKMNSTRSIGSESPITYSDEELFHLEMSDEGSGGKRTKLDHDHLDHLPRQVVKEDFGFIGQPQKRGAVQPLGLSASSVTITKKARKTAETKSDAKHKFIAQQQQTMKEEVDSDPQMARAAIYYLLILEDQLVSRNFYEGKNRIHSKSTSITFQHWWTFAQGVTTKSIFSKWNKLSFSFGVEHFDPNCQRFSSRSFFDSKSCQRF